MRDDYLQAARKVIDDPNILVNVVSIRVKQLRLGSRALVESLEKLSLPDIALREIAERRITFELALPTALGAPYDSVDYLKTTITPDNDASRALFRSFADLQDAPLQESPGFDEDTHFRGRHDSAAPVRVSMMCRSLTEIIARRSALSTGNGGGWRIEDRR